MEPIPEPIRMQMQKGDKDPQALLRFAQQTLDAKQQQTMQSLLGDPQALARLMQSERAQALLRKLQNE